MSTSKNTSKSTMEDATAIDLQPVSGGTIIGDTRLVSPRVIPETSGPLTDTQLTALDLYERGFNVIPLKQHEKKPFVLKPLFTSRLHRCSPACTHKGRYDIPEMFRRKNIGVVLGSTSGNLIDLDCETREAFQLMGESLTLRKIPFWAFRSSDGGHYLVRVLEGEIEKNKPKDESGIPDVEIWGTRHFVMIPPSIHPSGVVYQWVTPEPRFSLPKGETLSAVSINELEWLGIRLPSRWQEPELFGLPAWAAALSYTNRQTLGAKITAGQQRNRPFYNAATDMKGIGVDYREAEKVAVKFAERNADSSDKSLSDYIQEILATLKSAYSKEREPARESGEYLRVWEKAMLVAESYDWSGTFGRRALSRRAVYNALIERAILEGREYFRATKREVAEIANIHQETALQALHDLRDVGLVYKMRSIKRSDASVYTFLWREEDDPRLFRPVITTTGRYSGRNQTLLPHTDAEKDAARKLGMISWYVWKYLLGNPGKTPREIAVGLNLKVDSVRRVLKLLADNNVGMVSKIDKVYYAESKTDASLAEMGAYWFNGASPARNRKATHQLERELHNNSLVRGAIAKHEIGAGNS